MQQTIQSMEQSKQTQTNSQWC